MKLILTIAAILLLLSACDSNEGNVYVDNVDWFPTQEEAIKAGIEEEGVDRSAVIDIIEKRGETLVFYEYVNALGVASIAKSSKGFGWYRSTSYHGFSTDSVSIVTGSFKIQTYSGEKFSVVAGRVFDDSIKNVLLRIDGNEKKLIVSSKSELFFSLHDFELTRYEAMPLES